MVTDTTGGGVTNWRIGLVWKALKIMIFFGLVYCLEWSCLRHRWFLPFKIMRNLRFQWNWYFKNWIYWNNLLADILLLTIILLITDSFNFFKLNNRIPNYHLEKLLSSTSRETKKSTYIHYISKTFIYQSKSRDANLAKCTILFGIGTQK